MRTPLLDNVNVLVQEGIYENQEAVLQDAVRALLRSRPELCRRIALADYKQGKVSFARASEIAGVDQESFKELLREAGIDRYIEPAGDALESEVNQLMRLKHSAV
jgi:predicted HTH domain antitoxin